MALTTWDGNTVTTKLDPLTMSMPEPADEDYFWKKMGTIVQRLRPQNPIAPIQRQALSAPPPPQRPMTNLPRERMAEPAPSAGRDYASVTPRSLGRFQMNQTGNWGTFVNPADIPAGLQDTIMGGFYGEPGNWDTSNPSILGPMQWRGRGAQAAASAPMSISWPR